MFPRAGVTDVAIFHLKAQGAELLLRLHSGGWVDGRTICRHIFSCYYFYYLRRSETTKKVTFMAQSIFVSCITEK